MSREDDSKTKRTKGVDFSISQEDIPLRGLGCTFIFGGVRMQAKRGVLLSAPTSKWQQVKEGCMNNIKRVAGAGIMSLALVVGVAGFAGASSGTIDTTGPDSNNQVTHSSSTKVHVTNNNNANLSNETSQHASSGDAKTKHNTTGGSAQSGSASNANSVSATVAVDNSSSAGALSGMGSGSSSNTGTINNTGPDSNNEVTSKTRTHVDVTNNNNVSVQNSTQQCAQSGDARVQDNTTAGNATSGSASNTSSSSFTVRVTN